MTGWWRKTSRGNLGLNLIVGFLDACMHAGWLAICHAPFASWHHLMPSDDDSVELHMRRRQALLKSSHL